jgi:hypothetical protein
MNPQIVNLKTIDPEGTDGGLTAGQAALTLFKGEELDNLNNAQRLGAQNSDVYIGGGYYHDINSGCRLAVDSSDLLSPKPAPVFYSTIIVLCVRTTSFVRFDFSSEICYINLSPPNLYWTFKHVQD